MSTKRDVLAEMRQAFSLRYKPRDIDSYARTGDFEIDLDRLIYLAFEVAQEPYVMELKLYRDQAIAGSALAPREEMIRK